MTNRPSQAQLECLVEFLEQNPGIARGLLRTSQGKLETKRKWAKLAVTLNSLGGVNKNGPGWAKYWSEKKCGLKRQCAEHSATMKRIGDETADNLPTLSALENRLVAVLGGQQFATGDARWAVNSLPQLTRPTESPVVIEASSIMPAPAEMHSESTNMQISPPIPETSHNDAIPTSPTNADSFEEYKKTEKVTQKPPKQEERSSTSQRSSELNVKTVRERSNDDHRRHREDREEKSSNGRSRDRTNERRDSSSSEDRARRRDKKEKKRYSSNDSLSSSDDDKRRRKHKSKSRRQRSSSKDSPKRSSEVKRDIDKKRKGKKKKRDRDRSPNYKKHRK